MSLKVLTDADVKHLLSTLDAPAIHAMCAALTSALHAYSTGGEGKYQVHRQVVARPSGTTMLFMPSTLPQGSSVKVIGAPGKPSGEEKSSSPPKTLRGALMVLDADGRATGVLNAEEFTAFRTALGSISAYRYRRRTGAVAVFGAGKQALWHLRMALVLGSGEGGGKGEGDDNNDKTGNNKIRSVTIVNRSASRAQGLISRLKEMDAEGGADTLRGVRFEVLDPADADSALRVRGAVRAADVVFCATPSTEPVFDAGWVLSSGRGGDGSADGEDKTRFVSAIGSYKLDMQEIDPVYLRAVTAAGSGSGSGSGSGTGNARSYHPDGPDAVARSGGVILVDSREACYLEAGEIVKAGIEEGNIMEAGMVEDVQRKGGAERERLEGWLRDGDVVYKSVGMGIMDLAMSRALLELAEVKGVGTTVPGF